MRPASVAQGRKRAVVAGVTAVAAVVLVVIAVTIIGSRTATPTAQTLPNSSSPKSLPPSEISIDKAGRPTSAGAAVAEQNSGLASRRVAGKKQTQEHEPNRRARSVDCRCFD